MPYDVGVLSPCNAGPPLHTFLHPPCLPDPEQHRRWYSDMEVFYVSLNGIRKIFRAPNVYVSLVRIDISDIFVHTGLALHFIGVPYSSTYKHPIPGISKGHWTPKISI